MSINLTDEIEVKTKKGKLGAAKQIFLEGDTTSLQKAHEDNKAHFDTLDNRSSQMEESIKNISATGGASVAEAVTYDNTASGLEAVNVKGAVDELASKSKSHDVEISKKANSTDVTSQMQDEQTRVNDELDKKFDKESVSQETGESKELIMSQKAVSDKFSELYYETSETNIDTFSGFIEQTSDYLLVKEFDVLYLGKNILVADISATSVDGLEILVTLSNGKTITYKNIQASNIIGNFVDTISKVRLYYPPTASKNNNINFTLKSGLLALIKTSNGIISDNKSDILKISTQLESVLAKNSVKVVTSDSRQFILTTNDIPSDNLSFKITECTFVGDFRIYVAFKDGTYTENNIDCCAGTYYLTIEDDKKINSLSFFVESKSVKKEGNISIELQNGLQSYTESIPVNKMIVFNNDVQINVSDKKQILCSIPALPTNSILFLKTKSFTLIDGEYIWLSATNMSGEQKYIPIDIYGKYAMLADGEPLYNCTLYINANAVQYGGTLSFYILNGLEVFNKFLSAKLNILGKYPKTSIVFNFDEPNTIEDKRYAYLKAYGYVPTIGFNMRDNWQSSYDTILKDFIKNGIDICPYIGGHTNDYTQQSTVEIFTKQLEVLKENFERLGIYYPIMGCCSGHRGGEVLDKAMSTSGYTFKYIRCSYYRKMDGADEYVNQKTLPFETNQYPYTLEGKDLVTIKNNIKTMINDKYPLIMLMCHDFSSSSGDGKITKEDFTELVEFIHSLEKEGKVEVMSMRQYYRKHFPIQGENDDYTRLLMASINSRS